MGLHLRSYVGARRATFCHLGGFERHDEDVGRYLGECGTPADGACGSAHVVVSLGVDDLVNDPDFPEDERNRWFNQLRSKLANRIRVRIKESIDAQHEFSIQSKGRTRKQLKLGKWMHQRVLVTLSFQCAP